MYKKESFFKHIYINIFVTVSISLIFVSQVRSSDPFSMYFLVAYVMIFFIVSELVGFSSGLYSVFFILTLLLFQAAYDSFLLFLIIVAYYHLVKILRSKRLEIINKKEKHFRSLTNFTPQPIILKDSSGNVLFTSESINDLLGLKKGLPAGASLKAYLHSEDVNKYEKHFDDLIKNPNQKYSVELRIRKSDHSWIWIKKDSINLLNHENIKAVVSTIQDITFQKELDREKIEIINEEKKARSIAEKAVKDRDEFLSIASHELKTPLTTILLQLQTNLRRISTQTLADFSGADLLKSLQIAEKQSQRLSILIKDLLNVSMASTGRITVNPEKVDLSELVVSILDKYGEEINISGSKVQTVLSEDEIIGKWDPIRLEQAITNLFTNALKYGDGKKITIYVKKGEKYAYIKVKDRGPGISKELQKEIFEPFKRANTNSKVMGLGVGLFIAKQIVLAHKGEITLDSEKNKGSTFTIKLPL